MVLLAWLVECVEELLLEVAEVELQRLVSADRLGLTLDFRLTVDGRRFVVLGFRLRNGDGLAFAFRFGLRSLACSLRLGA